MRAFRATMIKSTLLTSLLIFLAQAGIAQIPQVEAEKSEKKTQQFELSEEDAGQKDIQFDKTIPMPLPVYQEPEQVSDDALKIKKYDSKTGKVTQLNNIPEVTGMERNYLPGDRGNPPEIVESMMGENTDGIRSKFNSLSQVTNPTDFPHRQSVKIKMSMPDGKNYSCSGSLIDYEWVLTAGHCIYKNEDNSNANDGWATSIKIIPAYENGSEPFGTASSRGLYSLKGWTDDRNFKYDIGWIHLDRPVGFLTGWFGYGYDNDDSYFKNSTFYNDGYPGEAPYNGELMYRWSGSFDFKTFRSEKRSMCQDRVGYGGQSGSGVYGMKSGDRIMYAVFSYTKIDSDSNRIAPSCYTRVDESRYNHGSDLQSDNRESNLDLVALNVTADTDTPLEGDQLTGIKFDVYNRSSDSQDDTWSFDIYLSDDENISSTDTHLSSQSFGFDFGASEGVRVSADPVMLPEGANGKKFIGIILNQSDAQNSNNDSDGWDAHEVDIQPTTLLTFKSQNPTSVDLGIYHDDILGNGGGDTELERRYEPNENFTVYAPATAITNTFSHWVVDGNFETYQRGLDVTVPSSNKTMMAIYETPDIPVYPRELRERTREGDLASATLTITNKSSSSLNWSASSSASWINVDISSGNLAAGDSQTLTLSLGTSSLSAGHYDDILTLSSPDVGVEDMEVPVGLRVLNATIPPSPEEVHRMIEGIPFDRFGVVIGGDPAGGLFGGGIPDRQEQLGVGYVYEFVDNEWTSGTMIQPNEPIAGSRFGHSFDAQVIAEQDFAVGGAPGRDPDLFKSKLQAESWPGAAYLFQKMDGVWQQQMMIQADVETGARFGEKVQLTDLSMGSSNEPTVIIGAPGKDFGDYIDAGAVFISTFIESTETRELLPLIPEMPVAGEQFGSSFDMLISEEFDARYLAVGANAAKTNESPGKVYIFEITEEGLWTYHSEIEAPELNTDAGFGSSVDIEMLPKGQLLLAAGAPNATYKSETPKGAVFTYVYSEKEWVANEPMMSEELPDNAKLGDAVSLLNAGEETFLMAGAPGDTAQHTEYSGSVLVSKTSALGAEWRDVKTMTPDDPERSGEFGQSLFSYINNGEMNFAVGVPGYDAEYGADVGEIRSFSIKSDSELPQVSVSPGGITAEIVKGDSAEHTIEISQVGKGTLEWSLQTENELSWLKLDGTSGELNEGESTEVGVGISAENLNAGTYNSRLILRSNDVNDEEHYLDAEIIVTEQDTTDVMIAEESVNGPDSLQVGSIVSSQFDLEVLNGGREDIKHGFRTGFYLSEDAELSEDDTLFSTVRLDTLKRDSTRQIHSAPGARLPSGMASGSYFLIVKVDDTDEVEEANEVNNIAEYPLYLSPPEEPVFEVSSREISYEIHADSSSKEFIVMFNKGQGRMDFSIPEFLTSRALKGVQANDSTGANGVIHGVSPASGSVTAGDSVEIEITLNASSKGPGTYEDTLHVITNDADNPSIDLAFSFNVVTNTEDVEDEIPNEFDLKQNYPNPFNPVTNISYSLPRTSHVSLKVFNVLGQQVYSLVDERKQAGKHTVRFDARNLSSGMYIYRIKAGSFTQTRKMMFIK